MFAVCGPDRPLAEVGSVVPALLIGLVAPAQIRLAHEAAKISGDDGAKEGFAHGDKVLLWRGLKVGYGETQVQVPDDPTAVVQCPTAPAVNKVRRKTLQRLIRL